MGAKDFDVTVVRESRSDRHRRVGLGGDTADLENVVSEGNDASFSCPDLLGLEFKGTIDGDTFEGDVDSDYGPGTFSGARN